MDFKKKMENKYYYLFQKGHMITLYLQSLIISKFGKERKKSPFCYSFLGKKCFWSKIRNIHLFSIEKVSTVQRGSK